MDDYFSLSFIQYNLRKSHEAAAASTRLVFEKLHLKFLTGLCRPCRHWEESDAVTRQAADMLCVQFQPLSVLAENPGEGSLALMPLIVTGQSGSTARAAVCDAPFRRNGCSTGSVLDNNHKSVWKEEKLQEKHRQHSCDSVCLSVPLSRISCFHSFHLQYLSFSNCLSSVLYVIQSIYLLNSPSSPSEAASNSFILPSPLSPPLYPLTSYTLPSPLSPHPPHPLSSPGCWAPSQGWGMVDCGLPLLWNISPVRKVQPHMSCNVQGGIYEVRPVPQGSYSFNPGGWNVPSPRHHHFTLATIRPAPSTL